MDEFLQVIAINHMNNDSYFNTVKDAMSENFTEELKEILSVKMYEEYCDKFNDAVNELLIFTFSEGMKAATKIKDGTYISET